MTGEGGGDDEQIRVNLAALPADLDKLVFPVSIYDADTPALGAMPLPPRAAQEDIGQSLASTRRESSPLTPESFHLSGSDTELYAPAHETESALNPAGPGTVFHR